MAQTTIRGQSSIDLGTDRARQRGLWGDAVHQFLRNRIAVFGLLIVVVFSLAAIFAPIVAPHSPYSLNYEDAYAEPSLKYPFGTDQLGRDVLSRVVFGARYALGLAVITVLITSVAGVTIGAVAAYFGGLVDMIIMRIIDIALAFPTFLLALAIVAFIGPSMRNIILVLAIAHAPRYTRLIRGSVLSVMQREFVEAARVVGANDVIIIRRHILPNSIAPTIVYSTLDLGFIVVSLAGLSFLGIGIQPPTPDWGLMLTSARDTLSIARWTAIFPGLAISITIIAFNFMGDGLRDALDPRLRL